MSTSIYTLRALLLALVFAVCAGVTSPARAAFDHSHAALDQVLAQHVHAGWVSYGELAADSAALDGYLLSLAEISAVELSSFDRPQAMALWINAYNALTIRLILDHPDVASIRDIDGAWDSKHFTVAGRSLTLNAIEHDILRVEYPDARLHMVLVCAARSCPELLSDAFTADQLEAQLDAASRSFVADVTRNRFDPMSNTLHVSHIFEWYGGDFVSGYAERGGGSDHAAAIRGFFSVYLEHEAVASPDVGVEWLDYDWRLNGSW